MTKQIKFTGAVLAGLFPTAALAHQGFHHADGFVSGLLHPLGGADHLLAALLAGGLAVSLGGRALAGLPALFVAALAAGGVLGTAAPGLPWIEFALAISVVFGGLFLAAGARLPSRGVVGTTAAFAVLHGFAHGSEIPAGADAAAYGAGVLVATAMIVACGMAVGRMALSLGAEPARRANATAGAVAGIAGLALCLGG